MEAPSPDEMSTALFIIKYGNYFWAGTLAFLSFIFLIKKGKKIEATVSEKQMKHEMKICAQGLELKQDKKYFDALDKMKADILREMKALIEANRHD